MKNIYRIFIALGVLCVFSLSSCDMDKTPHNQVDPSEIQTYADLVLLHDMHYYYMKNTYSGASYLYPDYGVDYFHPSADYGNYFSQFVRWEYEPGDSDIESYWYGMFARINEVNFLLEKIDELSESIISSGGATQARLDLVEGGARFFRALYYYHLTLRFCQPYSSSIANNADTGMILLDESFIESDDYRGRSTLEETFKFIEADLAIAEANITTKGAANSAYLTVDIVQALKAEVALLKKDYKTAYTAAETIINSGTYALTIDREAYKGMWTVDNNIPYEGWDGVTYSKTQKELLMVLATDGINESANTPGRYFISYLEQSGYKPQFFPTQESLNVFDQENDIRFDAFFKQISYSISGIGADNIYLFNKYPGNRALQTDSETFSLYRHKGKPFRLAEIYMIAAEAYYFDGNESKANDYLNQLKTNRIEGWVAETYSGTALFEEIQLEKYKEFFGEGGMRFFDLKRWGLGFERKTVQSTILVNSNPDLVTKTIEGGNFMFTWPIPKAEMDNNKALTNSQNPNY